MRWLPTHWFRISTISFFFAALFCSDWGQCQQDASKELVELEKIRKKAQAPALVVGYFEANRPTEIFSVGFKKGGEVEKVNNDDLFHLGSCTKAMTATLIGQLVERQELRWDSTLLELFPSELTSESPWATVTIDQLMRHQSGCPANADYGAMSLEEIDGVWMRRNILTWLLTQKRMEKTTFLYSNVGYILLGYILETKYRLTWEEVIQKNLFDPLEMKSAGFGSPCQLSEESSYVWGHRTVFGVHFPTDVDNRAILGPAGTVHASPEDWSKFLRFHANAMDARNAVSIVSNETMRALHHPDPESQYAGGWVVLKRDWAQGNVLHHNGSNTVWYCGTFIVPEEKRGMFAMTNAADAKSQEAVELAFQWMLKRHAKPE